MPCVECVQGTCHRLTKDSVIQQGLFEVEGVWVCVCAAGRADPRCTVEQPRHRKTADISNREGVEASAIGLAAGAA